MRFKAFTRCCSARSHPSILTQSSHLNKFYFSSSTSASSSTSTSTAELTSWFHENTKPSGDFYGRATSAGTIPDDALYDTLTAYVNTQSHRDLARLARKLVAHPGLLVCAHQDGLNLMKEKGSSVMAAFTVMELHTKAAKKYPQLKETRVISGSFLVMLAAHLLRNGQEHAPQGVTLNQLYTLPFDEPALDRAMSSLQVFDMLYIYIYMHL